VVARGISGVTNGASRVGLWRSRTGGLRATTLRALDEPGVIEQR
jgi:hypothetical protein